MRVILPWLLMPLLSLPLGADEVPQGGQEIRSEVQKSASDESGVPWVGLGVAKLEDEMRAHAPEVPEGVGFLVESVERGGPASMAGLRRYDILWKFEDQLLINEAQFATLLKLRKIGDRVKLSTIRSGKQLDLDLVLGEMPERPLVAGISPADLPLIPNGVPGMPQVRVTPHDRIAELTRADGSSAKLFYEGDQAQVLIMGTDNEVIYDGPVRKEGEFVVPKEWCHSVGAMLRSLYKANNPNWMPRRPRPRVVMPPKPSED